MFYYTDLILRVNFSLGKWSFNKFLSSICFNNCIERELANSDNYMKLFRVLCCLDPVLKVSLCWWTALQFFGYYKIRFKNTLFFSVTCVSLPQETPPTALILDVPSQGSSPSVDIIAGVTLKAPQVGLPSSVLFLDLQFSKGGPWPATSTSLVNLFKMHIHGPHPRPLESEALGWAMCVITHPPDDLMP
jgi:hypothetical protein